MKVTYGVIENKISDRLEAMVKNARSAKAFFQSVLYPDYQARQIKRWETEGRSEGFPWPKLNPRYAEWKKKRYSKYPYSGGRMGIATGTLFASVVGEENSRYHRKLFSKTTFRAGTSLEYAPYFAEARPIFRFSKQTYKRWMGDLKEYLMKKD